MFWNLGYLLFSWIVLTDSCKPKLCIHCKHFSNSIFSLDNRFGKCKKYPTQPVSSYYLVNGKKDIKYEDFYYCSTARQYKDMCGPEGKDYVYRRLMGTPKKKQEEEEEKKE